VTTSILRDVFYPHPPERVWRALTDPAALSRWLMPNDFQPRLGHRFTFRTDPVPPDFDGIVHCEVTELDPPRRLAYTWNGGPGVRTVVSYRLEGEGGGTRLYFEQSGFDLDQPGHRAAYDAMSPGWGSLLGDRLRAALDVSG
jgi:uncharacterized protein YndB with AHSA1/START domain